MRHSPPLTLLLADDNPTFLSTLRAYFETVDGVRVVAEARDGQQAVALADLYTPDLVVIDLAMPRMGGLEATRILKARSPVPRVAVLTLNDGEGYRRAAFEAGVDFFISKDRFHQEIRAVLDGMARP